MKCGIYEKTAMLVDDDEGMINEWPYGFSLHSALSWENV